MNYYHILLKRIKQSQVFLYLFTANVFISIAILFVYGKANSHLFVNSLHTPFLDSFFALYTNVGDGWIYGILVILLTLRWIGTYGLSVRALACFLFAGLGAQAIKHIFETPRPKTYFAGTDYTLNTVAGVSMLSSYSMPSGHTATAFSMFLVLIFASEERGRNSRTLQAIFFVLAWLVGISRIYLSQHFLEDVIVGSIIGVVFTLLAYTFFETILSNKSFYHKSL